MPNNSTDSRDWPLSHPHVTLNSSTEDILEENNSPSPQHQLASRQPSTRSLTSRTNPPAPISTNQLEKPIYPASPGLPDGSRELLLPPHSRGKSRRFRDDMSPAGSRRSSIDSDPRSPFASPFDDSRAATRPGSPTESLNTQTVQEKFNITPSAGLILFPEDVEKDDYLHNPDPPGSKGADDYSLWNRRALVNLGGLIFVTIGLLCLFIGYPILTFAQHLKYPHGMACPRDPDCIADNRPLLQNIRRGTIDPDTPEDAKTKKAADGTTLNLVFSDEFNTDGRSFYDEDDPYFQAVDLWYGVTQDLEWYDPDAISTANGTLNIRFDAYKNHKLNYRSGMLQSWNKLCFKGGILEASTSLPGRGDTIGYWPGFWSMGNLGRPGYASTTDGMWPYTYWDECDIGITANQSSPDGISALPGMKMPACTCNTGDDTLHPTPGKSRTSPELDVFEASVGYLKPPDQNAIGTVSQSFQLAPFDIWYQPDYDYVELYDQSTAMMNVYRGGVYQQAFSALANLNNDWYDGNAYQRYAFDYNPGDTPDEGHVTWFIGQDPVWKIDGRSMRPNGNIGYRVMPREPMSIVANLGMSNGFSEINYTGIADTLPATMRFDYIRIYQDTESSSDHYLTCDPPGFETTQYIAEHPKAYKNREKLLWKDTGYAWPKNSFVDGSCG